MAQTIIVTDLTRFGEGNPHVCMAGINPKTGQTVRPLPYLKESECEKLNVLPGAKIRGEFKARRVVAPHVEDFDYAKLTFQGPCTSDEFLAVLQGSMSRSVVEGFEVELDAGQKVVLIDAPSPKQSLVTIEVDPRDLKIVEDNYGKLKAHITDGDGDEYAFLSITDLGFHRHAKSHHSQKDLNSLNRFLRKQDRAILRIGLSRKFKDPRGREGFWIQLNGIYTFPDFHKNIRSYTS